MTRPHREEERKEATIRAVWASVARYGCTGTTIERVAEIAGFSKGVIHYYFDSKKALLLAAFEAYFKAYEEESIAMLAGLGREPSAEEILDAIVDVSLPAFSPEDFAAAELPLLEPGESLGPKYKSRLFVQFYSYAMTEPDFSRAAATYYEGMGETLAGYLERLFPSAGAEPDEGRRRALSYAVGLMALIDGLSFQRLIGYMPAGLPDHGRLARRLAIEPARRADR
jgi:TetR/AcrR family transcriptional repressor of bet genes